MKKMILLFFVIAQTSFSQITFELKTTPQKDFNLVSIPANAGFEKASDLMAAVPNCNSVARWNAEIQGYNQYIVGVSETNFDITPGAYYVNVTIDGQFTINGDWNFEQPIYVGYNDYVLLNPDITTSNELSIYTGCEVYRWDVDLQTYTGGEFAVQFGYAYHIKKTSSGIDEKGVEKFGLKQNYPNPFNSSTVIQYMAGAGTTNIIFMNAIGQEIDRVTQTNTSPGLYEYIWNPDISTGVYFCRINDQVIKLIKVN